MTERTTTLIDAPSPSIMVTIAPQPPSLHIVRGSAFVILESVPVGQFLWDADVVYDPS